MRNIAEHAVYSHMVRELGSFLRLLDFCEADEIHCLLSTEAVDATYGRLDGIWEDQIETRL